MKLQEVLKTHNLITDRYVKEGDLIFAPRLGIYKVAAVTKHTIVKVYEPSGRAFYLPRSAYHIIEVK